MIIKLESLVIDPYFNTYLKLVELENLDEELEASHELVSEFLSELSDERISYRYQADKWSIGEVIHHCIETEMIFNFRALTIARESEAPTLAGFDENAYVKASGKIDWTPAQLLLYFDSVRSTTLSLLSSISNEQMAKCGNASGKDVQVEALFFVTSGHFRHHLNVIKERY
ncbi:DinB family protein [Salibacteraceae bacterium]|nr:DinB family protein [Salibacteraceae bacterium]